MKLSFPELRMGGGRAGGMVFSLLFLALCGMSMHPSPVLANPIIGQLTVGTVTSTTAVITWSTDIPSDSFISYLGSGETKVQNMQDDTLVTSHAFTITGLKPSTKYSFTVNSADTQGNNVSASGTPFTTAKEPTITTLPSEASPELEFKHSATTTTGLLYNQPVSVTTGTLALEGGTIYFLMSKERVRIPFSTFTAFTGLGYTLANVQKIDISNFRISTGYVISSATEEHPWGSWLKAPDGTVYYSHHTGLIGVPSMAVFTACGGTTDKVLPMNAADARVLELNPHLPVLIAEDSRLF